MTDLKRRIRRRVEPDLAEIEIALQSNLQPHLDFVASIARHILMAGGKRVRPLLMVLSARICGYDKPDAKTCGIIFEYLHAATLLHDDLVDGADFRRGKDVAHRIFGSAPAVLTGDFLLARSLSIAAATGNPEIIRVIAEATEHMSTGEIHQLHKKGDIDLTESEYLDIIRRKTAVLMEAACRTGALLAGAPGVIVEALSRYGLNLGLAFQMADDLLDYTAESLDLGKLVGADLREGKLTLPVIFALHRADAGTRKLLCTVIQNPDFSEREFLELKEHLDRLGGIAYTREKAIDHIRKAKSELEVFAPSEDRTLLECMADYALHRSS